MQVQTGVPRALSSSGIHADEHSFLGHAPPCLTEVARVYLFGKVDEATVKGRVKKEFSPEILFSMPTSGSPGCQKV